MHACVRSIDTELLPVCAFDELQCMHRANRRYFPTRHRDRLPLPQCCHKQRLLSPWSHNSRQRTTVPPLPPETPPETPPLDVMRRHLPAVRGANWRRADAFRPRRPGATGEPWRTWSTRHRQSLASSTTWSPTHGAQTTHATASRPSTERMMRARTDGGVTPASTCHVAQSGTSALWDQHHKGDCIPQFHLSLPQARLERGRTAVAGVCARPSFPALQRTVRAA